MKHDGTHYETEESTQDKNTKRVTLTGENRP